MRCKGNELNFTLFSDRIKQDAQAFNMHGLLLEKQGLMRKARVAFSRYMLTLLKCFKFMDSCCWLTSNATIMTMKAHILHFCEVAQMPLQSLVLL